ncbi:ESCO1/2 family N-acetyltransferase [Alloyangia pacifica]|uniref:ESCO1/2 family N-acetyltransferase n=1 Tax=Alloyangia pacifica TaxID=311180 RepID=UPI001CD208F2|nr:ESCO1/2 family N-acetyltransferase [Alloyangia pacifica]MCA0995463.1 ESCO1/2 family N-acetyltransferase [Alloyangia pacifica]
MFHPPITACTEADIPALAGLMRGVQAPRLPCGGRGVPEVVLASALSEGARLLAYRAEAVPRGVLMWRWRKESSTERAEARRAQLDHIWVEPSWRRRGVARRLIAAFEAEIAAQGASGWLAQGEGMSAASGALMRRAGACACSKRLEKRFQQPA